MYKGLDCGLCRNSLGTRLHVSQRKVNPNTTRQAAGPWYPECHEAKEKFSFPKESLQISKPCIHVSLWSFSALLEEALRTQQLSVFPSSFQSPCGLDIRSRSVGSRQRQMSSVVTSHPGLLGRPEQTWCHRVCRLAGSCKDDMNVPVTLLGRGSCTHPAAQPGSSTCSL